MSYKTSKLIYYFLKRKEMLMIELVYNLKKYIREEKLATKICFFHLFKIDWH